nr:MAG TPA: hypothetical protein [Caudoviricetes sp.]
MLSLSLYTCRYRKGVNLYESFNCELILIHIYT